MGVGCPAGETGVRPVGAIAGAKYFAGPIYTGGLWFRFADFTGRGIRGEVAHLVLVVRGARVSRGVECPARVSHARAVVRGAPFHGAGNSSVHSTSESCDLLRAACSVREIIRD